LVRVERLATREAAMVLIQFFQQLLLQVVVEAHQELALTQTRMVILAVQAVVHPLTIPTILLELVDLAQQTKD
jgi:hypothetical protein